MQRKIIDWIINWLINNLTEDMIKEWVDKLKQWLLPLISQYKTEVFTKLRAAAADTATQLDDKAVDALEMLVDAFLPDSPKTL